MENKTYIVDPHENNSEAHLNYNDDVETNKQLKENKGKRILISLLLVLLIAACIGVAQFLHTKYVKLYPVETVAGTVNLRGSMSYESSERIDNIETLYVYYEEKIPEKKGNFCFVVAHKDGIDFRKVDVEGKELEKLYKDALPRITDPLFDANEHVEKTTEFTSINGHIAYHVNYKGNNNSYVDVYSIVSGKYDVLTLANYHIGTITDEEITEDFQWLLDHLEFSISEE